tara:strand:+ start:88 stop:468 length:381 start_codon:yes stop_codon:yes gene_type:complete
MFNIFKKNKNKEPEECPASITFKVNTEGDIWIDGNWDSKIFPTAPYMFAELLVKVSSEEMFLDTLVFLKKFCLENESQDTYEKILIFIRKLQEAKLEDNSNELVVKPTDFFNLDRSIGDNKELFDG